MKKVIILTALLVGTAAIAAATQLKGNEPKQFCQLPEGNQRSWSNCIGKSVKVKGKMPKMVMSHVQRNVRIPGEKQISQSYMDALNYQFVLLSEQPITCKNEFEVEGILQRFSLGGTSGSKNSYANYDIHVNRFTCLGR